MLLSGRDPVSGTPLGRRAAGPVHGRRPGGAGGGGVRRDVLGAEVGVGVVGADRRPPAARGPRRRRRRRRWSIWSGSGRRPGSAATAAACIPTRHGLTVATFRQTTSRADDPQIHTHAVISAKVQTDDGRWLALDARYLKRHQRMLGGLYQSVLRAELTHRFGVGWGPIVNGQAEIAGVPDELLEVFSKRSVEIDAALAAKLDEFRHREGRDPSRFERAALEREAAADTRSRKSGHGAADLATRWRTEAADGRLDAPSGSSTRSSDGRAASPDAGRRADGRRGGRGGVGEAARRGAGPTCCRRSATGSVPCRRCRDTAGRTWSSGPPTGWSSTASTSTRQTPRRRRASDGRSVWIEPTAPRFTIRGRARRGGVRSSPGRWTPKPTRRPRRRPSTGPGSTCCRPTPRPRSPATTGWCWWSGRPGPARPRMLAAAVDDLHRARSSRCSGWRRRPRRPGCCERDTRDAPPTPSPNCSTNGTGPTGHRCRVPARRRDDGDRRRGRDDRHASPAPARPPRRRATSGGWPWSVIHRQLQAVGRGGLFAELCATAGSSSSNRSTGSPSRGKPPRPCCCVPAILAPSTPTRRTAGSSPAPSTTHLDRIAARGSTSHSAATRWRSWPRPTTTSTPSTGPSKRARLATGDSTRTGMTAIAGGEARPRRRRRRHPTQRPPTGHHRRRTGPQPGTVDRHRHRRRRIAHRVPPRRPRPRHPARRLRPRARPARVRGHRARLPVRHRHRRHRPRLPGDHPPRPVRRCHPRPGRQRDLRHHRQPTTSPKPATSSKASSPSTGPTSPPSPNAVSLPSSSADTNSARRRRSLPGA